MKNISKEKVMYFMVKRALAITIILLINSGCAVYYHDRETGADHVWGIGHLATKIAEPEDHKQAVIRQVTLTGLSLGLEEETLGISLGWDQRQRVNIFDENASISIQRPEDGNSFLFKFGTEPFADIPVSNNTEQRTVP